MFGGVPLWVKLITTEQAAGGTHWKENPLSHNICHPHMLVLGLKKGIGDENGLLLKVVHLCDGNNWCCLSMFSS